MVLVLGVFLLFRGFFFFFFSVCGFCLLVYLFLHSFLDLWFHQSSFLGFLSNRGVKYGFYRPFAWKLVEKEVCVLDLVLFFLKLPFFQSFLNINLNLFLPSLLNLFLARGISGVIITYWRVHGILVTFLPGAFLLLGFLDFLLLDGSLAFLPDWLPRSIPDSIC